MNKRSQLLYDFICLLDGLAVNRESCLVIDRTPELKYLLKQKLIKRVRISRSFSNSRTTVLHAVDKKKVYSISCPECNQKLSSYDVYKIFNTNYSGLLSTPHKYSCSFRNNHRFETHNIKQIKF
jgi:beta-lactamase class D